MRPSSPSEQIIRGSNLELLSIGDQAEMARVSWTDSVEWQVGVTSTTTETGSVVVNLIGTGSSLLGLFDTISSCPERWVHHSCASGATLISAPAAVPVDGISRQLAQFDAAENTWFMIRLWRNHSNDIGAETVQLRLRASGASGELTASPARVASLPGTGTNIYLPAIVSGGAITLGLATAGLARLTRRWWPAEPEPQLQ
ncbi:hypothetical protein [Cryobacterium sp. PH29-G1]|uniref:hypothetical protein n=1 Tax=Cryobacterium sp. PH29-G1 TaxID=3046211 RepID=UPI0024B95B24|nr:hypothetical protein [Cryobacterium sp. PH29-G1]MDJ0350034.1 hypothetical protein [Cryobacterium sp. PH29-G1]